MNDVTAPKKAHLWAKGQSGNPKGRPPGSKNQISLIKLQVEGEMRARMSPRMADVVEEMFRQALPTEKVDPKTGEITIVPGDKDMLKTIFKSWVSGARSSEDETPREKISITIGKLDQVPLINGQTFKQSTED